MKHRQESTGFPKELNKVKREERTKYQFYKKTESIFINNVTSQKVNGKLDLQIQQVHKFTYIGNVLTED